MLNVRPPFRPRLPAGRTIGYGQPIPLVDFLWKSTWPYTISTIIAALIIILGIILFVLEIALLALLEGIDTGTVYSSGVGIWCGFFIVLATSIILVINCVNRVRIWAIAAFILTIIAACFAVIAFSVNAARIQLAVQLDFFYRYPEPKLAAAEIAMAVVAFLLCLAFIGIYIFVFIRISGVSKQRQQNRYPIQRP